jgi:UDP-2,3-diacylglucosamine pyrophosphatase LpxH
MTSADRTVRLPLDRRVCLISDLHLGDGGASDAFGTKDARLRAFLDRVASRADALVIVGDGFDVAQAWSIDRILDAHREVIEDLVALSRVIDVYYLRGNHEGSAAAVRAVPLRYADQLMIGDRIRVEHGNAYDPHNLPGDRGAFLAARVHAVIEAVIRAPVRVPMRKHYHWSTRLGHWVFYRYGQWQAALGRLDRVLGRGDRARERLEFLDYWGRGEWGDPHGLLRAAPAALGAAAVDVLVCGHSHQPGVVAVPGGTYVNTGSWTFEDSTYAICDHGRIEVRRWPDGVAIGDEEYRGILGPHADKTFFDWWAAHYRGYLRYDVDTNE